MKRHKVFFCSSFIVFSFCTFILTKNIIAADPPTIAVLDFGNNSIFNRGDYESLSKGLAEMIITGLNQAGSLRVVERQKLRSILDELKLSQTGAISEESSLKAGKLLGAQHLVFGGFMVTPDSKIRIDVRIVQVETGLTLKANEVTGKTKDVLNLISKLDDKILTNLNVRLAENQKKSEGTDQVDLKVLMLFSQGVGFEDAGNLEKAAECYQKVLAMEPDFQQAKKRLLQLKQK